LRRHHRLALENESCRLFELTSSAIEGSGLREAEMEIG
jgi:hypothetical protein